MLGLSFRLLRGRGRAKRGRDRLLESVDGSSFVLSLACSNMVCSLTLRFHRFIGLRPVKQVPKGSLLFGSIVCWHILLILRYGFIVCLLVLGRLIVWLAILRCAFRFARYPGFRYLASKGSPKIDQKIIAFLGPPFERLWAPKGSPGNPKWSPFWSLFGIPFEKLPIS